MGLEDDVYAVIVHKTRWTGFETLPWWKRMKVRWWGMTKPHKLVNATARASARYAAEDVAKVVRSRHQAGLLD